MNEFPKWLEERALEIVRSPGESRGYSQAAAVLRDLKLALAELEALRVLHRGLEGGLSESECRVTSELGRGPGEVSVDFWRLEERLLQIRAERRRFSVARFEAFSALARRMLELLNRYEVLSP